MSGQVNVNLDEEVTELNTHPTPAASHTRPPVIARNNPGLGDRLNTVFREIRPLVEHARMGNNSRLSLPTWLPRNVPTTQPSTSDGVTSTLQRPQSSIAHVSLGPNSQTYAVNERTGPRNQLSQSASIESNMSDQVQVNMEDISISVNPSNNNNIQDNAENESQSDDGSQQVLDVRALLTVLLKYSPFYILLLLKFMYDHREGLFTFIILMGTFLHSNTLVRREHGKQMNRSTPALAFEFFFSTMTIGLVHYMFGDDKLLPNIVMFPSYTSPIDVWELLWLVCLTDLIVKIITIDLKIVVTAMPAIILPFQKRGKVYLFIEAVSQLYRSLLPIQPWLYFLMQSYTGNEKMIGMFLATVYVVCKVVDVLIRLQLLKSATWTLLQSVNLGTKPTGEQLLSAGDNCPICHDDYATPVRLECGHIFCELCIAAWLDREHTCPLCRAKVADEPTWRDGSTTHHLQMY